LHKKVLTGMPFNKIADEPVDRIVLIQLSQISLNALCFMTCRMASCSIVSKALAKSSLIINRFFENLAKIYILKSPGQTILNGSSS
jgi:hypothetical protein